MEQPTPHELLMGELIKGKDLAARLQGLLGHSPEAGLIVDQILHAFSRAIDAAKPVGSEVQREATCARKRKAAAAAARRDTSRRRQSSGFTKVVKNVEDGQSWRKYGQKDIQNSEHPKSYFRCTHKYDQKCAALRQVQRCDQDPESFVVTYIGQHTCQDPHDMAAPPHVDIHQTADGVHAGSHLICFAPNAGPASTTTSVTTNQTGIGMDGAAPGSASGLPILKVEGGDQEEVRSCLTPGSSAVHSTAAAAGAGPDQGDVSSAPQFYEDGAADMGEFFGLEDIFDLDDH